MKEHYCDHCGAAVQYTAIPDGYSADTGERLYVIRWRCVRYNFFTRHTNFLVNRNSDGDPQANTIEGWKEQGYEL